MPHGGKGQAVLTPVTQTVISSDHVICHDEFSGKKITKGKVLPHEMRDEVLRLPPQFPFRLFQEARMPPTVDIDHFELIEGQPLGNKLARKLLKPLISNHATDLGVQSLAEAPPGGL